MLTTILLFVLTGCGKKSQIDYYKQNQQDIVGNFKEISSCHQEAIETYFESCEKQDSKVFLYFENDLILCNDTSGKLGSLSFSAPGDPYVQKSWGVVKLCEENPSLYFKPLL